MSEKEKTNRCLRERENKIVQRERDIMTKDTIQTFLYRGGWVVSNLEFVVTYQGGDEETLDPGYRGMTEIEDHPEGMVVNFINKLPIDNVIADDDFGSTQLEKR